MPVKFYIIILVATIFGAASLISKVIYILVGLSAVYIGWKTFAKK